jgi:hypothetical protein
MKARSYVAPGTAPAPETIWAKALDLQSRLNSVVSSIIPSTQWLTSGITQTGSYQTLFTLPVVAGSFRVHGCWQVSVGGGAAPAWMQFAGPATSLVYIQTEAFYGTTPWQNQFTPGLGAMAGPTFPAGTQYPWQWDGLVTFTAAGNLVQSFKGNGTNGFTIVAGSFFDIWQVG